MRSQLVFVLTLLAGLALICEANVDAVAEKKLLEQLCRHERSAPVVTKVEEVKSLIRLLKTDATIKCNAEVAAAIEALEPVVELDESVCSDSAASKMINFWQSHVKSKTLARRPLPKQLRAFFIAYGLQASKLCKTTMIEQLATATKANRISELDTRLVTEAIREHTARLFSDMRLENLLAVIPADKPDVEPKKGALDMEPLRKEIFDRVRELCVNKFQPIYESLMTPIVRLAAIGINYRSEQINERMEQFQSGQLYRDWFVAVLACETTAMFNAVSVAKMTQDADGNTQMITVLDKDDIEQLEKWGLLAREDQPRKHLAINYAAKPVVMGNLVVDEEDADLVRSMKGYHSILKDINLFQLRMMKKLPYLLKSYAGTKAVQWGLSPASKGAKKFGASGEITDKTAYFLAAIGLTIVAAGIIAGLVFLAGVTHGFIFAALLVLGIVFSSVLLAAAANGFYLAAFNSKK